MDEMRADKPFKTRFQLLGGCPFEPREVIPMMKSQELVSWYRCWYYLENPLQVDLGPGRSNDV